MDKSKLKIQKKVADQLHSERQSIRIEKGKAVIKEDQYWKTHAESLQRKIKKH